MGAAEDTPVVRPQHAAELIGEHWTDDTLFVIGRSVARNSRLRFRSLYGLPGDAIKQRTGISEIG